MKSLKTAIDIQFDEYPELVARRYRRSPPQKGFYILIMNASTGNTIARLEDGFLCFANSNKNLLYRCGIKRAFKKVHTTREQVILLKRFFFNDVPGIYACRDSGDWESYNIYKNIGTSKHGKGFLVADLQYIGRLSNRLTVMTKNVSTDINLHNAMRLVYLLVQRPKGSIKYKEVLIDDRTNG